MGGTGTKALFYFTTNALIKAEILKSEPGPFDPDFGLTGGEDSHLFERLALKGARFIVSKEAITYEDIPLDRGNKKYLFNRALRGGQAFMRRELLNNKKKSKHFYFKTIIIFLTSIFLYSITTFSKQKNIKYFIMVGASVGKIRSLTHKIKNLY